MRARRCSHSETSPKHQSLKCLLRIFSQAAGYSSGEKGIAPGNLSKKTKLAAADALAFVSVAKYPPVGERSWGPTRAMTLAGMSDMKAYLREANALTVTFAMIETQTAIDNLDAIASTEGIDALFVGPSDLSIALTDGSEVEPHSALVERELDRVVAAAGKHNKVPGLYCANAERAVFAAKRGFRFLAVGSDLGFLRMGTAAQLKALKG